MRNGKARIRTQMSAAHEQVHIDNAVTAASAANGIIDHVHDWVLGTTEGDWVSMAVPSDGSYGVTEGIIFSYPVTCKDGDYSIVQGLELSDFIKAKMKESEAELTDERDTCSDLF